VRRAGGVRSRPTGWSDSTRVDGDKSLASGAIGGHAARVSIVPLFDRLAPEYDEIVPFFTEFARQLVDWVAVGPELRVLDLGCGRGALAVQAQRRGAVVTAVDAAPAMVRALRAQHPGIDARVMDAQRLDFADGAFDLVLSGFVMHLLPDPVAAAAEVRRVLIPGGRFAFSRPGPWSGEERWKFLGSLNFEFSAYASQDRSNTNGVESTDMLAGFTEVTRTAAEVHLPIADADTYWAWACSHGSRGFIDALPADRREEYRARLTSEVAKLDPLAIDRGAEFWLGRTPSAIGQP
jgi:SAM-dependent methyltransferase